MMKKKKNAAAAAGTAPLQLQPHNWTGTAVVVVAVRASATEISDTAVVWALTHVARHGDTILLLALNLSPPPQSSSSSAGGTNKLFHWRFPFFAGSCASVRHNKAVLSNHTSSSSSDVSEELCSQMMLKLRRRDPVYSTKVNLKVMVLPPSCCVAAEAKRAQATWVVLDKDLKHEEKRCLEQLHCNIVVMRKRSRPKVLRLNLAAGSPENDSSSSSPPVFSVATTATAGGAAADLLLLQGGPAVTVVHQTPDDSSSTPEPETAFDFQTTDDGATTGTSSSSVSTSSDSAFCANSIYSDTNNTIPLSNKKDDAAEEAERSVSDSVDDVSETWTPPPAPVPVAAPSGLVATNRRPRARRTPTADALLEKISRLDLQLTEISAIRSRSDLNFRGINVRDVISLSSSCRRSAPPGPPPLCSVCQHKTPPLFGKPPRWFSYAELERATAGFSRANFLAEGGYGSVHRGVLPDGQAIAVKQHKLASSSQGDVEFCSEVEVLSCAQHRNVVMLIGFCVEDNRRLLVYEYICNGSLDSHLYSTSNNNNDETLHWAARAKIAVGAARGLRYLHEECRVGCIIHRDMRPNNILVTHDYEPLVGDFGLARWQPDGDTGVETRVIGTFGYLAPEYTQSGQITEKADVYSFGVVLVELVTGRKAVDINRPKGQQFLTEWARPLLEDYAIDELIDPRLGTQFSENEVYCMLHAANLCIRRDPHSRPRMSHVLRILEGDMVVDAAGVSTPTTTNSDAGSRSWRLLHDRHGCSPGQHDDSQRLDEEGN